MVWKIYDNKRRGLKGENVEKLCFELAFFLLFLWVCVAMAQWNLKSTILSNALDSDSFIELFGIILLSRIQKVEVLFSVSRIKPYFILGAFIFRNPLQQMEQTTSPSRCGTAKKHGRYVPAKKARKGQFFLFLISISLITLSRFTSITKIQWILYFHFILKFCLKYKLDSNHTVVGGNTKQHLHNFFD